jgi:SRSO17 transposase
MSRSRELFTIGAGMKGANCFLKNYSRHWSGWSRSKDTKNNAKKYFTGILLPGKRKNMSGISNRINLDPNATQQFITDSPWTPEAVMTNNIQVMSKNTAKKKGVLIIDDTGQEKKGNKSPGVKRQYSGTLGHTGNCQISVACFYGIPGHSRNADAVYWPTGMRLYIPQEWVEDEDRCEEVGIPGDMKFQTKPEIGLKLIDCVRNEKVPHCAITTDSAYGSDGKFRKGLRDRQEPYVVSVIPSLILVVPEDTPFIPVGTKCANGRIRKYPGLPEGMKPKTPESIVNEISKPDWQEITWSEGTKGKLSGRFFRMRVRVVVKQKEVTNEMGWLIFERRKGVGLKVYMCWGLDDFSLEDLVKIAHIRWVIEQGFKQMKGELGLDEFEGRTWRGWHHHAAMVMIAFSYLMLKRIEGHPNGEKLPTLPQVRKELARLYVRRSIERRFKISPEEADAFLDDEPVLAPE